MDERTSSSYHLNCVAPMICGGTPTVNCRSRDRRCRINTTKTAFSISSEAQSSLTPLSPPLTRLSPPSLENLNTHHLSHAPQTRVHQSHKTSHFIMSSSYLKLLLLVLISLLTSASAQQTCTDSDACFPPVGNLALGRTIRVNSTCANNNLYCPFFLTSDCMQCSEAIHSPSSLNDDNNDTFWISEIGRNTTQVALQLDFEGTVAFQDMTLVWQSVRPYVMILERSCDFGETWSVYRYYAADCPTAFMMEHTDVGNGIPPFNGTAPVCTNSQTELFTFDFERSEMTFSTSEHIPLSSEESVCYHDITNIRVVMLDLFPEITIFQNSSFQYYGVREWIVRGTCMCNGHAAACIPRPGEERAEGKVYTGCSCRHNTAGIGCEECQSGFNNAPYQPATPGQPNICEACMCNGHASDCEYDTTVSAAICLNCSDNTAGRQCDQCAPGYYQDPLLLLNNPDICRACECDPAGISDVVGACDGRGQCSCKSNVGSLICSECRNGYFNLTADNPDGCQRCACSSQGSVLTTEGIPQCNGTTGMCVCRDTVQGEACDTCRPGYYDLSSGCLACQCNVGGSVSHVCDRDSVNGRCSCKPNVQGTLCDRPESGFYFITLDTFRVEAEEVVPLPQEVELVTPIDDQLGAFTGQGFIALPGNVTFVFPFSAMISSRYQLICRFSTVGAGSYTMTFVLSSLSASSASLNCSDSSSFDPSPASLTYTQTLTSSQLSEGFVVIDSVCLSSSTTYQLSVYYAEASNTPLLLDSLVLLPDVALTSGFYMLSGPAMQGLVDSCLPRAAADDVAERAECEDLSFTLATEFLGDDPLIACNCDPEGTADFNNTVCQMFGGGCGPCQPGVTGQQCDTCLNGYFGFSSDGCEACDCDPIGSISPLCSDTGVCSCKPGVGGPTCSDCLPDHYNFTSSGCTPCSCSPLYSNSPSCNVTTGQCPCPEGIAGQACSGGCLPGFFNLTAAPMGCQSCDCDVTGSIGSNCNLTTGQCQCVAGLGGRRCDQCTEGFFNTGSTRPQEEACAPCVCSGRTSECSLSSEEGRLMAIMFNFSQLCPEDPGSCGEGWTVLTGDNEDVEFGPNNVNGLGYVLDINMMPMVFVPDEFLGNRISAYGFNFTVLITVLSAAQLRNEFIVRLRSSVVNASLTGSPHVETMTDGLEEAVFIAMTISLVEGNWMYEQPAEGSPNLLEFLLFLTDLTEISFTADFTVDFIELVYIRQVSLFSVSAPASTPSPTPSTNSSSYTITLPSTVPIEACECPASYQGLSCEVCARGYARPSGSIADPCIECECNGQTLDCDTDTAICLNCGGNTTGTQCERCLDGFYGDPTAGIPCLPCECPLLGNSFSSTCFLNMTDGLPTCDDCREGYEGRQCEICADGFFGNPLHSSGEGRCTTCMCHGNVDPALGPVCDMETGRCMNCQNNTTGFECELCQFGFYGDPITNISCRVCPCDVRGTAGYCDTLLGTCTCLPNVMGELCDSCQPEFFNISQSVGCSACNCDAVGAMSSNCNQTTGECSCLANVGSPEDIKCRACTPGYFNLTADVGCEACGCSGLSVSSDCDDNGVCTCQEGAVGVKCDDCAFGYTGQVPDCEMCHECYFQWTDILSNFSRRVDAAQASIDLLTTTYYSGHSLESLESEIDALLVQLSAVNASLSTATLEERDVEVLETHLEMINASLISFKTQIINIQRDLAEVERLNTLLIQFDGTLNMSDVMDLNDRLRAVNTTATSLSLTANDSVAQLMRDQVTIDSAWAQLIALNETADRLTSNFTDAAEMIDPLSYLISNIRDTYMMLRSNLTALDIQADRLIARLSVVMERGGNVSGDVYSANATLSTLFEEVVARGREVEILFSHIGLLNDSIRSLEMAAEEASTRARNLMSSAQESVSQANTTLQNITDALNSTAAIAEDLEDLLRLSGLVQAIQLPSPDYARELADRILANIVPDDVVARIMEDAAASQETAEQALELVRNASAAVMSALMLVDRLEEDLACTNSTQNQVEEMISTIEATINWAQADVNEVLSIAAELYPVFTSINTTINQTQEVIAATTALGIENRNRTNQLLGRSTQIAADSVQIQNDFREAQRNLSDIRTDVNATVNSAISTLSEAEALRSEAQGLQDNASSITAEDIDALLMSYMEELAETDALQQRILMLSQEMDTLIETFTSTAQRLQQCYRTP